jgi:hypothetical protein
MKQNTKINPKTIHNLCVSAEKRVFKKLKEERAVAMPNRKSLIVN